MGLDGDIRERESRDDGIVPFFSGAVSVVAVEKMLSISFSFFRSFFFSLIAFSFFSFGSFDHPKNDDGSLQTDQTGST